MRKHRLPIAIACIFSVSAACADQPTPGVEARVLADALLKETEKPGYPGCAVGVYREGGTVYEGAYGLANVEHRVAIDPARTVFNVGSVSKQFTAASILLLAKDGKLRLDDDIRKHVPEIRDYGHTITIDHLLHHTSGLRDYTELWWMAGKSWWDLANEHDALTTLSRQSALDFIPGSKYGYSNTGYFLLSMIVHRTSGTTLAQFARERIFAPLGMKNTYFEDALGRVTPHLATGYALQSDGSLQRRSSGWIPYGDSDLHTTVADLGRWQHNFDAPTVGGSWLVQQMEQRGALNDGRPIDYARGLQVYDRGYRGRRTVMHDGGTWDGFRSDVMRLPGENLSIAVLCNADDAPAGRLRDRLAEVFVAGQDPGLARDAIEDQGPDRAQDATVPLGPEHIELLGTYWNRDDVAIRRIERDDGKIWYVRGPESRTELAPLEGGQFLMLGVNERVVITPMPPKGGRRSIQVVSGTPAILEKVAPFATSTEALVDYAGQYANREIGGARWTFAVSGGKLVLVPPPYDVETLNPVFKDAFLDGYGGLLLVFQRDVSGRVTSVLVDTVRVRNMTFARITGRSPGQPPSVIHAQDRDTRGQASDSHEP
jgi:CubicO group peptidase (beta-lactamase class C family)